MPTYHHVRPSSLPTASPGTTTPTPLVSLPEDEEEEAEEEPSEDEAWMRRACSSVRCSPSAPRPTSPLPARALDVGDPVEEAAEEAEKVGEEEGDIGHPQPAGPVDALVVERAEEVEEQVGDGGDDVQVVGARGQEERVRVQLGAQGGGGRGE